MNVLTDVKLGSPEKCPYLSEKHFIPSFFFANDVIANELDFLLSNGWRRFGLYYFRPECKKCFSCIPVRIPVNLFKMGKSQRRNWRKNSDIQVRFEQNAPVDKIYDIYQKHSKDRFGNECTREEFEFNFISDSCPSVFSLYYIDNNLVATGFIDVSSNALSSAYFVYYPQYLSRSIGIFSILKEIEAAADLKLDYYYLGYYVKGNAKMQYKIQFKPYEWYNWEKEIWVYEDIGIK